MLVALVGGPNFFGHEHRIVLVQLSAMSVTTGAVVGTVGRDGEAGARGGSGGGRRRGGIAWGNVQPAVNNSPLAMGDLSRPGPGSGQ